MSHETVHQIVVWIVSPPRITIGVRETLTRGAAYQDIDATGIFGYGTDILLGFSLFEVQRMYFSWNVVRWCASAAFSKMLMILTERLNVDWFNFRRCNEPKSPSSAACHQESQSHASCASEEFNQIQRRICRCQKLSL